VGAGWLPVEVGTHQWIDPETREAYGLPQVDPRYLPPGQRPSVEVMAEQVKAIRDHLAQHTHHSWRLCACNET
jgi:hypothetical protein